MQLAPDNKFLTSLLCNAYLSHMHHSISITNERGYDQCKLSTCLGINHLRTE